jgi:hypothetical protein
VSDDHLDLDAVLTDHAFDEQLGRHSEHVPALVAELRAARVREDVAARAIRAAEAEVARLRDELDTVRCGCGGPHYCQSEVDAIVNAVNGGHR